MLHPLLLKAAATLLTLGAAAAALGHVSVHLKDEPAPLRPSVVGPQMTTVNSGGRLTLTPSVRGANVTAVTSTAAS